MIIKSTNKPLRIIGYVQSSLTADAHNFISKEHAVEVITPAEFIALNDHKIDYQYIVMFSLDRTERKNILDVLDSENLDCFTFIHDTSILYSNNVDDYIGRGTFVAPYSTILLNAKIGKHCVIETHCLVAHYTELKNNVHVHVGTLIAGKTIIGNDCTLNFKSAVLNAVTVCDDVELGAISTITKDITTPGRYVGSIARYVGKRMTFNG